MVGEGLSSNAGDKQNNFAHVLPDTPAGCISSTETGGWVLCHGYHGQSRRARYSCCKERRWTCERIDTRPVAGIVPIGWLDEEHVASLSRSRASILQVAIAGAETRRRRPESPAEWSTPRTGTESRDSAVSKSSQMSAAQKPCLS